MEKTSRIQCSEFVQKVVIGPLSGAKTDFYKTELLKHRNSKLTF